MRMSPASCCPVTHALRNQSWFSTLVFIRCNPVEPVDGVLEKAETSCIAQADVTLPVEL